MLSQKSAWGSGGYTSTDGFKVGKTDAGTIYRGRLTFAPVPAGIVITSIKLTMNRTDGYNTHTIKLGVSSSGSWGAETEARVNWTVGSGRGSKSITLTSMAGSIAKYTSGDWYLHVTHGSGTNSYTEFTGGSNPKIEITYEYAASTPTFSASSVNMGSAVTINTNRKSSNLTHTIRYNFGAASGIIGTEKGVGASVNWTPPLSLAAQIPNGTSGTATITCITYLNGVQTGQATASLRLNVPGSVVPTISAINVSEAVSGLAAKFGAYIQSKSKLRIATSAAGAQGSSISSYSVKVGGTAYSGSPVTTNTITSSGTLSISVTVRDSRGRTASKSASVSVLAYAAPYVTSFSASRCNAAGTAAQGDGTRVWVSVAAGSHQINGKNTTTAKVEYRTTGSTAWTSAATLPVSSSGIHYVVNRTNYALPASIVFSAAVSYDLRVTVSDYFTTSSKTVRLAGSAGLAYWDAARNRIGFGTEPTSNNAVAINPGWTFNAGAATFNDWVRFEGEFAGLSWTTSNGTVINMRPYKPNNLFQITLKGPNTGNAEQATFNIQDNGTIGLAKPLPVSSGGTGANSAAGARAGLSVPELRNGVVIVANQKGIGTNVTAGQYWQCWNWQDDTDPNTYPAAFAPSQNGKQNLGTPSAYINKVYALRYSGGTVESGTTFNEETAFKKRVYVDKSDGIKSVVTTGDNPKYASVYLAVNDVWTNALTLYEDRTTLTKPLSMSSGGLGRGFSSRAELVAYLKEILGI